MSEEKPPSGAAASSAARFHANKRDSSVGSSDGEGMRPRSSSFKDSDKYVRSKSGTFVRQGSGELYGNRMPEFKNDLIASKTQDKNAPTVLMREVLETYKPHILTMRRRLIEDCCRDLRLNNDHIHIVEQQMRAAIEQGLSDIGHGAASVKCFPTYVSKLPTGAEVGRFLSLDLGGTNFRVIVMELTPDREFLMDSKIYQIPGELMRDTGVRLFDHIAKCLSDFVHDRELGGEVLPLGFTFSFPCRQEGLARGILVKWTKGFCCSGVEGRDVVQLLREALERRNDVDIDVCAVLNDTTGCLMSCAWQDTRSRIGLILGTGTNACYLESVSAIGTLDEDEDENVGKVKMEHMIVNTEWGAFGDNGELDFCRTKWDRNVDEMSVNPGKQIFEKMISGMYMGELIRQVLIDLMKDDLIFLGLNRERLMARGSFLTKYASEIESDPVGDYPRAKACLRDMGFDPDDIPDEDYSSLRYVCEVVSRRASFMASAGITALLKKMDYKDVVIAIDGSLFRYHPHFKNVMQSRISQLMGIDYKFDLLLSEDGSGRGAALVAAVLKS